MKQGLENLPTKPSKSITEDTDSLDKKIRVLKEKLQSDACTEAERETLRNELVTLQSVKTGESPLQRALSDNPVSLFTEAFDGEAPREIRKSEGESKLEWDTEKPAKEVLELTDYLKALGMQKGNILDMGAGVGRNSIALAKEGYDVVAFEKDKDTENKFKERLLSETKEIKKHIKLIPHPMFGVEPEKREHALPHDYILTHHKAVVDYGMSHYLSGSNFTDELGDYRSRIYDSLDKGGILLVVHFSEDEPTSKLNKRSKESIHTMFSNPNYRETDNFDLLVPPRKIIWKNEKGQEHRAWVMFMRRNDPRNPVPEDFKKKAEGFRIERLKKERKENLRKIFYPILENYESLESPVNGVEVMEKLVENNPEISKLISTSAKYQIIDSAIREMKPVLKKNFLEEVFKIVESKSPIS